MKEIAVNSLLGLMKLYIAVLAAPIFVLSAAGRVAHFLL